MIKTKLVKFFFKRGNMSINKLPFPKHDDQAKAR